MSGKLIMILVAVVIAAAVIAVSIKLQLPGTAYNPGEPISGSLELQAKKAIDANRLLVSIIGTEVTRTYEQGRSRTHSREIYRDEHVIDGVKQYQPGARARHEFELTAPNIGAPDFMNSAMGQALGAAMRLLANRRTELRWRIEARLDAKGIDLATSRRISISINMPQ
jgi:hypothetical protein